jgi:hypothetical protein
MQSTSTIQTKPFNTEKLLTITDWAVRLWLGYILVINSRIGITVPLESLGMPEHIYQIIKGMWDTGFMMHAVKGIELIGGLMLIFNFRVPLALSVLAPVVFNIFGMHVFLFNSLIGNGLYMVLAMGFLFFHNRKKFIPLFQK